MNQTAGKENKNSILVWVLLALLVGSAFLIWSLIESREQAEELSMAKIELTSELNQLMTRYDDLELANDSLMDVADAQRMSMRATIDSINRLTGLDRAALERLKKRVYRLQVEKAEMIGQLDSLSAHVQKLEKEKALAELNLQTEREKTRQLAEDQKLMEQTIAMGSMLTATAVKTGAIKRWKSGKESETRRARRADEIKVCFTIGKNTIAAAGEREVFIRVTTPKNTVLSLADSSAEKSFVTDGTELLFSARKLVDYQGEAISDCAYVPRENFEKGSYRVELYTEEYMIGAEAFELR
jgi:cell division protein FtsB